jgi:hypothetical protein
MAVARYALLAVLTSLVIAAPAGAVTVTVGADLNRGTFEAIPFGYQRTLTNTTPSSGGNLVASPINGYIRSWSVIGASEFVNLKLVRPVGDGTYTTTGHIQSGPISSAAIHSFPIAAGYAFVKAGDLFGVDPTSTNNAATIGIDFSDPQASYSYWWPRLDRHDAPRLPEEAGVDGLVGLSVVVESSCVVPQLRGLRLKTARVALTAGNCRIGKVRRPAKRRLRKKARFVVGQDAQAGMHLPAEIAIGIDLGRKPKSARR